MPPEEPIERTVGAAQLTILQQPLTDRDFQLPNVGNNHRQNWLDCVRSRQRPVADRESR